MFCRTKLDISVFNEGWENEQGVDSGNVSFAVLSRDNPRMYQISLLQIC